jgi:hypothetical protein
MHVPIQRHPRDRGEDALNRLFSRFQSISFNMEHVSMNTEILVILKLNLLFNVGRVSMLAEIADILKSLNSPLLTTLGSEGLQFTQPGSGGRALRHRPTNVIQNGIVSDQAHASDGPTVSNCDHPDFAGRRGLVIPAARQSEEGIAFAGLR